MNTGELANALNQGSLSKLKVPLSNLDSLTRQFEEDIEWLSIDDFKIKPPEWGIPYFHYSLGEERNSINNADPSLEKEEMFNVKNFDAPGLAYGELFWLFLNTQLARKVIPDMWLHDDELRKDIGLKKRKKHFNTLNEIFWLGRWKFVSPCSVKRDHHIPGMKGNVDWHATVKSVCATDPDLHLNIEVKNLVSSLRYLVGADPDAEQFVKEGIRGTDSKFPDDSGKDLNILCITVYMMDRTMISPLAEEILKLHAGVDAIVFWQAHGPPLENFCRVWRNTDDSKEKKGLLIESLFKPPAPEHVWPLPAAVPLWDILPWQQTNSLNG